MLNALTGLGWLGRSGVRCLRLPPFLRVPHPRPLRVLRVPWRSPGAARFPPVWVHSFPPLWGKNAYMRQAAASPIFPAPHGSRSPGASPVAVRFVVGARCVWWSLWGVFCCAWLGSADGVSAPGLWSRIRSRRKNGELPRSVSKIPVNLGPFHRLPWG